MSPHTGTEPGNKICNGAGESGALTDTTVKGGGAFAERCCGDNGCVGKGFSNPFDVAGGGEAKDGKRNELEFSGEAVEVFFLVFIDMGKESVARGGDTLNGKEVIEGEVTAVFAGAVSNYGVIEKIELLNRGGEMGVD